MKQIILKQKDITLTHKDLLTDLLYSLPYQNVLKCLKWKTLQSLEKLLPVDFLNCYKNRLDNMSDLSYERYIDWHLAHCDKEELLGASNHYHICL